MNNLLKQSHTATEVAREAFAAGDFVTGIAAIQLAAQLIQLARLKSKNVGNDLVADILKRHAERHSQKRE